MAYKNLSNEQASKLSQNLGQEFTAAAKNDLINFADALLGLVERADAPFAVTDSLPKYTREAEGEAAPKSKTPAKGRSN